VRSADPEAHLRPMRSRHTARIPSETKPANQGTGVDFRSTTPAGLSAAGAAVRCDRLHPAAKGDPPVAALTQALQPRRRPERAASFTPPSTLPFGFQGEE